MRHSPYGVKLQRRYCTACELTTQRESLSGERMRPLDRLYALPVHKRKAVFLVFPLLFWSRETKAPPDRQAKEICCRKSAFHPDHLKKHLTL